MSFIIRGNLCGYICRDCREALSNVMVRIYQPQDGQNNPDVVTADPKYTLRVLDEKEVDSKKKLLLAEGKTDDSGSYEIKMPKGYDGGPVVVDVRLTKVPNQKSDVKKLFSLRSLPFNPPGEV